MRLRLFKNSSELYTGVLLELSQLYRYQPPSHSYPEEWDGDEPTFRVNGTPCSREEVLEYISVEELEKLIDSAVEDTNWNPPRPDAADAV